ncbi:hypothetical protein G4228_003130 [Cervus hanglu yarkandensis]|nr:hypothetical protein G4228_003130 [Cervus hanglu yarkandensis]
MEKENCSSVTEFIFLGSTSNLGGKVTLFATLLLIYLINLLGNLGMIILIRMDPQLQTPMYLFLSHLSFCDLCYSTAVGPKMLVDLLAKNKPIPFYGCALQFLIACTFADSECLLLAVMAYDWYKTVRSPLLYAVSMSSRVCSLLMAGVYLMGMIGALIHTTLAFSLCFCGSNEINHFFCDLPPLYLLSCSDTQVNELTVFIVFGVIELSSISGVLVSYCYIILAVSKIHSAEGRFKAFSTCASHLTAVAIFQGTLLFMYFRPSSIYSLEQDKMTSLFYTLMIPMLNPLIYSLQNKDVKNALEKLKNKRWFQIFISYICIHI